MLKENVNLNTKIYLIYNPYLNLNIFLRFYNSFKSHIFAREQTKKPQK